jgi:RNA processing factor Prp31
MFKKIAFLILFLLLMGYQDGAFAKVASDVKRSAVKEQVWFVHISTCENQVSSTFSTTAASDKDSKDEEYKALQKELEEIIEQMKMLEKEAREKFLKEILPQIKKELEKLRERLREWHPKDDESRPRL